MLEHITLSSTLYMEQFYGFPGLTEGKSRININFKLHLGDVSSLLIPV